MFQRLFVFALILLSFPLAGSAQVSESTNDIPPSLQPWVKWVEADLPSLHCPSIADKRVCTWPGTLKVQVQDKKASFTLEGFLDEAGEVAIPGTSGMWPQNIVANGKKPIVGKRGNNPVVYLEKGAFLLSGSFSWQKIPETLVLPSDIGRVFLSVGDSEVPVPRINGEGQLFLKEGDAAVLKETDTIRVSVFRKLHDGVPFNIANRFELNVSGRAREVDLGPLLFEGSVPLSVDSALPLRIDKGKVKIFVRPGKHIVNITTISPEHPKSLSPPSKVHPFFDKQEVWVWVPNDSFQSVELSGLTAIDSNRTSLPKAWKDRTTFLAEEKNTLKLSVTRRGMEQTPPNALNLHREIWLDLDGRGYTIRDTINGEMNRNWRLDYQNVDGAVLGRVGQSNDGLLITKNANDTLSGVELRNSKLKLDAELRLKDARGAFNIVGWNHDVKSLSANLHLPPGWTVFHGQGIDRISNTWMSSWTLWDLFFVFMIMLGFFQLFGWKWALVSLFTLLLTHGHSEAPEWSWIILIVSLAILRALPEGIWRKALVLIRSVVFLVFLTILAIYANDQVMSALFPQVKMQSINFHPMLGVQNEPPSSDYEGVSEVSERDAYKSVKKVAPMKKEMKQTNRSWAKKMQQIDPNAVVQTGPGLPDWKWNSWTLEWSGPVQKDQEVQLWLISSWLNRVLSFFRVLLLFVLAFVVLARTDMRWSIGSEAKEKTLKKGSTVALFLVVFVLLFTSSLSAETPPKNIQTKANTNAPALPEVKAIGSPSNPDLLDELKVRLEQSKKCPAPCVVISKNLISIDNLEFKMEMEVSALKDSGFKLPGPSDRLVLKTIELDGQPTNQIRKKDGLTLVRIPKGRHKLKVIGTLAARDVVTLQFDENALAEFTQFQSSNWTVDGLSENGVSDASLQLTRLNKQTKNDQSESDSELPPWFTVRRHFSIGLPWKIETEIVRRDSSRPQLLKFPLLENERVISDGFRVESVEGKTQVAVELPRGEKSIRFVSEISILPVIKLEAAKNQPWTEEWRLTCSRIWRCDFGGGIAPIRHITESISSSAFYPWPGEKLDIKINRPEGMAGASSTVTNVEYEVMPGNRLLLAKLMLEVRASQGGWQKITLPKDAELQKITIDAQKLSIRPVENILNVPLKPGTQRLNLEWQQSWERKIFESAPAIDIGSNAVNIRTSINRGDDRWVLWAAGSPWGPAVLFWPRLIIMLLIAIGIGRIKRLPIKTYEWMILVIGLSQLPPVALIPIVFWFLVIRWRQEEPHENPSLFNLTQLAIPFITLIALGVLYAAIHTNLLINIDMQVKGANSTNRIFRWYLDRSTSALPQPTIITISDWFWRIGMLVWAIWLVVRLYKWAPWAWSAYRSNGTWKSFSKKVPSKDLPSPGIVPAPLVIDSSEE